MTTIHIRISIAAALLILSGASSFAQGSTGAPGSFEEAVQPFLKTHCLRCHGASKQEGEFRLDVSAPDLTDRDVAQRCRADSGYRSRQQIR